MDDRYKKFFELFNERDFYECHEVLEDLWMETTGAERPYYQGLIQTATAFYHLQNGNWAGSRKLFTTGLEYLKPFPDSFMSFDLGEYKKECEKWLALVLRRQRGEEIPVDSDDFPVLKIPA
jgi:predicted metal-dependent hydrolase